MMKKRKEYMQCTLFAACAIVYGCGGGEGGSGKAATSAQIARIYEVHTEVTLAVDSQAVGSTALDFGALTNQQGASVTLDFYDHDAINLARTSLVPLQPPLRVQCTLHGNACETTGKTTTVQTEFGPASSTLSANPLIIGQDGQIEWTAERTVSFGPGQVDAQPHVIDLSVDFTLVPDETVDRTAPPGCSETNLGACCSSFNLDACLVGLPPAGSSGSHSLSDAYIPVQSYSNVNPDAASGNCYASGCHWDGSVHHCVNDECPCIECSYDCKYGQSHNVCG